MGRRKGPSLTRDDVVQAALQIVRMEGADALGVARVARELGIRPPSLYNHVASGPELAVATSFAAQRLLVDDLTDAVRGVDDPRAQLETLCRAIRRWVHANEGLYALMARVEPQPDHPDAGATDRALLDLFLRPLGQLGVPVDRRVHAIRALRSAVHGFVLLESARQFQLAADSEVSFELLIDAVIRGLVNAG